jgi:hypothetical protein
MNAIVVSRSASVTIMIAVDKTHRQRQCADDHRGRSGSGIEGEIESGRDAGTVARRGEIVDLAVGSPVAEPVSESRSSQRRPP